MSITDILVLAGISWLAYDFIGGCISGYKRKREELKNENRSKR